MARQFGGSTYLAIKAAFRDLVHACGGPKMAAAKTRGCQSRISEAMAAHEIERFPAIDQIADMEAECGIPIVTRHLADMAGFRLEPISVAGTAGKKPMAIAARMAADLGELQVAIVEAESDGTYDAVERATLRGRLNQLRESINTLDGHMSVTYAKPQAVK
jgi:hypothetical protein